ncbi:PDZ and LIM domain protein Zasp-like isoform X42 [Artemia franciscana]|uniref:PDZ and LIM domain protein Zasp-like isoform X42 n=1 Tax=Artemia franciscana TaxID=6661 RepID=UPI0032DA9D7C
MAQVPIKLSKFDNQPWGFRIQGGKDFSVPITVQKVNGGSLAERAGLNAGDTIVAINGIDALKLRHKEAQDAIVRAGNNFEMVVVRGNIWKPVVTPLAEPKIQQNGEPTILTKTSLAANQQPKRHILGNFYNSTPKPYLGRRTSQDKENHLRSLFTQTEIKNNTNDSAWQKRIDASEINEDRCNSVSSTSSENNDAPRHVGSAHNLQPAPFGKKVPITNGHAAQTALPLAKQYNSPAGLYSEESIAETLTAQAEVLAQGVLGVNFKKNERQYDPAQSEVLKMIQEADSAPRAHETGISCEPVESPRKGSQTPLIQSHAFRRLQNALLTEQKDPPVPAMSSRPVGVRPVEPPKTKPKDDDPINVPDLTKCGDCDKIIVGIFVKIKGKNLHVECFKCATCGTSLKNIGYYDIGGKLYCDMHARQAAKHNTPAEATDHDNSDQVPSNDLPRQQLEKLRPRAQATAQLQAAAAGAPIPDSVPAQAPAPEPIPVSRQVASPIPPVIKAPTFSPIPPIKQERPFSGDYAAFAPRPASPLSALTTSSTESQGTSKSPSPTLVSPRPFGKKFSFENKKTVQFSSPSPWNCSLHINERPAPITYVKTSNEEKKPCNEITTFNSASRESDGSNNTGENKDVFEKSLCSVDPNPVSSPVCSGPKDNYEPWHDILTMKTRSDRDRPVCCACHKKIERGPFVTALGRNWCPEHFVCANESCKRHLQDTGFVEEKNELYCESCFENYLAPICDKCQKRVVGDCLKAIGKQFHPECFACAYCGRLFGNSRFYLEDGLPYCEADWNELFTTKCFGCGFPIEAGDRWVEAMNNNYHSQCFNCSVCASNLEGIPFYAKAGKAICKSHAVKAP